MTDEEIAEEYAEKVVRHKMAVHYIFNEKEIKDAVIYGLKAGKDMADADLATVAYMQGAERYKTKWHKVSDGDLPKEKKLYLATTKEGSLILAYYNGTYWETKYNTNVMGHALEIIVAWCELPIFKEM